MWSILNWFRRAKERRLRPPTRPSFRPTLTALEPRYTPSTGGVVSAIQPSSANPNEVVVYALTADRSLWECTTQNGALVSWVHVSPAAFDSISASYNDQGQPVVYGIVSSDHSLWENNPEFNPVAADPNDQWQEASAAAFDSISATYTTVGGSARPVVNGIVSSDHSLWENNPAFAPSAPLDQQWMQVSPGAFVAVSAGIHQEPNYQSNTPMPVLPTAFALTAGDRALWEQDPYFNPTSGDLNTQWREASSDAWASISVSDYLVGNDGALVRGLYPVALGIKAADDSLWAAQANIPGASQQVLVSSDAWLAVDQNVAVRASDQSLWTATRNNPTQYTIKEISVGTFEAVSTPQSHAWTAAVLTDHSLWLNSENFPDPTNQSVNWTELSPSGTMA
jgi:hypothetical protein